MTSLTTRLGPIDFREAGQGEPLLFVHGVLVTSRLWDTVAADLAVEYRCLQPTLPLGGHQVGATATVTVDAIVGALIDMLDLLGIEQVTLVGNDTGGALCQVLASRHQDRVKRLVLTSCDAYNHFLPTALKPVQMVLKIPGAVHAAGFAYRSHRIRRSLLGAGLATKYARRSDIINEGFDRFSRLPAVRRDFATFIDGCRPSVTNEAVSLIKNWATPTLLAWSQKDPLFPESDARRLAADLNGKLVWITDSYAFSPLDQPQQVIAVMRSFLRMNN